MARRTTPTARRASSSRATAATARSSARRRSRSRRSYQSFPGPLDVLGKLIVGLWMGLAHGAGWAARAVGEKAAQARELEDEHRRDGLGLLGLGVALLLAVALWFGS